VHKIKTCKTHLTLVKTQPCFLSYIAQEYGMWEKGKLTHRQGNHPGNPSSACSSHAVCPYTRSMCSPHYQLAAVDESRVLNEVQIRVRSFIKSDFFFFNLPGFVPIIELSSVHLGIRGSRVWKKAHMQMATRAASTP